MYGRKRKRASSTKKSYRGLPRRKSSRRSYSTPQWQLTSSNPWTNQKTSYAGQWKSTQFPDTHYAKLKVAAYFDIAEAAVVQDLYFAGNNPSDPFLASGTVVPIGYNSYNDQYVYARTMASSCYVRALAGYVTTTGNPMQLTLYPSNSQSALDRISACAQPYKSQCIITPLTPPGATGANPTHSGWNHGYAKDEVKGKMSTAKIIGRSDRDVLGDPNLIVNTASATAPGLPWFWCLNLDTIDSTSTYKLTIEIIVTYYIKFELRRNLALDTL